MSLMEFVGALDRIGDDPRPLGVILYFRGFSGSTADLQTMRDAILRLRERASAPSATRRVIVRSITSSPAPAMKSCCRPVACSKLPVC